MCCVTICLQRIPKNFPANFIEGGKVCFDMPTDLQLNNTSGVEELSDIEEIRREAVLGFSLPMTEKNRFIVDCVGRYADVIICDSGVTLPQTRLRIVRCNDENRSIEVDVEDSADFWKEALEDMPLCEAFKGETFVFDEAFIRGQNANGKCYDGTLQGIMFPLADVGGWLEPQRFDTDGNALLKRVCLEDFRPHFHFGYIFEKIFCAIGYQFKSEVLENCLCQMGTYILSKEIKYDGQGQFIDGEIQTSADFNPDPNADPKYLPFDTIISDVGNNFFLDPEYASYLNNSNCGRILEICLKGEIINEVDAGVALGFSLVEDGNTSNIIYQTVLNFSNNETIEVDICEKINVPPNIELVWILSESSIRFTFSSGFSWSIKACDNRLYIGDTVRVDQIVDCEKNALDFFKGFIQLIGGRIVTNEVTKTVCLYPASKVENCGDGFYRNRTKEVQVLCESKDAAFTEKQKKRFLELCFCDPEDEYVKSQGFDGDTKLYSRIIEINPDGIGTETICNECFEATLMRRAESLESPNETPPFLHVMHDNTDGEISTCIKPRVLWFAGNLDYGAQYILEGNTETEIPTAYQVGVGNINPEINLSFDGILFDLQKQKIIDDFISDTKTFKVLLDLCQYQNENYRDAWCFTYEGTTHVMRPKRINNFIRCLDQSVTDVEFVEIKECADVLI